MIDINISKVCKSFGFDLILNNIDITVQKGEKVGLIGTNGSGKSTILKIIAGQESIDSGSLSIRNNISIGYLSQIPEEKDIIVKDYINSAFKEIIELKEKLERYEDKLLTEDYKVITKYMNLQEKFISLGGYEYETKIQKILPVFNITEEILNRNFNTLSGGEKTIISLIRLLLQEPDVLLLDEPTNHLDINKMIWLEKTLKNYKGTIILVSHDRYFMDNVINKVYLLTKRGIEVYHGNYSYYIKESENRLLLELKNYKDQQKQITAMENSIKRLKEYGRLCGPSGGEIFFRRAANIEKRLEKLEKLDKPEDKKKLNITFDTASRSGKDVLTINNLNLSYGTKEIFNNLNLSIKYQDRLCLVGDNGVGKSTLIKEILKGNNSIKLGSNIKIGYIPQEIEFEDINLSVLEEARKYYKQALEMSHENFIASDIIDINIELNDELDSNAMLLKLAKENPEGVIFYQLAENSFRLGTPIKKVLNYYDKAHELGYLTDIEYIDVLSDYEKPDKTITKIIKKCDRKKTYPLLPVWCKKKMAVRYLYGENGIKQNIKKAIIKLFECRQEMPANTCVNAILGRGFELKKNFSLAHKMYDMAYQLIEQETKPSCDCAYSYYAHSLIEGVGVKQDVEEAKSIILKAVQKFKKFICSHTAYYYAYFALQGDEKFDISKAYELLSFDYPFVRFDISRIVYLTKLEEKLRIRSKKLNNLLADGKDVYDKKEWKYYRKAITEDCPKPYWRNI